MLEERKRKGWSEKINETLVLSILDQQNRNEEKEKTTQDTSIPTWHTIKKQENIFKNLSPTKPFYVPHFTYLKMTGVDTSISEKETQGPPQHEKRGTDQARVQSPKMYYDNELKNSDFSMTKLGVLFLVGNGT